MCIFPADENARRIAFEKYARFLQEAHRADRNSIYTVTCTAFKPAHKSQKATPLYAYGFGRGYAKIPLRGKTGGRIKAIAASIGQTRARQGAVGQALKPKIPSRLIIPCHRVIGCKTARFIGYRSTLAVKAKNCWKLEKAGIWAAFHSFDIQFSDPSCPPHAFSALPFVWRPVHLIFD